MNAILNIREVARMIGLSPRTIYDLVRRKRFPAPVRLEARRVGWVRQEVEAWLEKRIALRDRSHR